MARLLKRIGIFLAAGAVGLAIAVAPTGTRAQQGDFAAWLEEVKREAGAAGISRDAIEAAFAGIAPIARVLELDRRQPEFTRPFWAYLDRSVSPARIERGRKLLARHGALLREIRRRYNVQPRFLVAFWGLESNFGDDIGGFPVIGALATLAYDKRRSAFFRAQLFDALKILDQGHITPAGMRGSWAGAMGQLQFIPSTFIRYAVDHDGDRRRDIWHSLPDVFASAANYLSSIGWRGDETWGREVRLPPDFDWDLAGLKIRKPIAEWQRLGVRRADGRDLPKADISGAIVLPAGHKGPAFLVYRNFHAILTWNRSILYALAIGHLADRIAGKGRLIAPRPAREHAMSRAQIEEMQGLLVALGFDPGTPDGVVGSKTRATLKAYQRQVRLAADGHPTPELLAELRQAAARKLATN
ncbi:MAG: lytic murein transglycosylase [Kiloniellaceae bacterium]